MTTKLNTKLIDQITVNYEGVVNPMTAAMKRKWLKALRSGKYRKARGQLHNRGGHCCLGVAEIEFGIVSLSDSLLSTTSLTPWTGTYAILPHSVQFALAQANDEHAGFPIEMIERLEPYRAVGPSLKPAAESTETRPEATDRAVRGEA